MKQKIALIREKTDDVLAVYIEEYFKLVGFIVRDVIVPEESEEDLQNNKYDFIIRVTSDFSPEEDDNTEKDIKIDINLNVLKIKRPKKITLDSSSDFCHFFLYNQILEKLFTGSKLEELKELSLIYAQRKLFYFLYNKGNLKFVEEYYPIVGESSNVISDSRQKAFRLTLNVYQESYYQLEHYMDNKESYSYHSVYMMLKLRYKINDISDLLGSGHIYRTANMLERLDIILNEYPDFIRAYYLRGHICAADSQYLREAELYYKQAIANMNEYYPEDADESFLWYQLGRYFEKKRKNMDKAEMYYKDAYKCDQKWFRILFKMAWVKKRNHQETEAIKMCNQIITNILNGYDMRELTPKRQIYIYKCFRLLGDTFSMIGRYDLAERSYKNAIQMSQTESNFYDELHTTKNGLDCFKEVLSACKPKQPIYRKLIHCAMGMADDNSAEEYYLQMIKS